MTDKVQKIREEVEKLMYGYNLEADIASCENAEVEKIADTKYQLCKKILEYIDSLQEEPVSKVWHDTRTTVPENSTSEIICYRENEPSIITIGRIATGTVKWAFLKDLLNMKEKPVSEDLKKAAHEKKSGLDSKLWIGLNNLDKASYQYTYDVSNDWSYGVPTWHDVGDAFKAGARWKKEKLMNNAVEWLEANAVLYLDRCSNHTYEGGYFIKIANLTEDFRKTLEGK